MYLIDSHQMSVLKRVMKGLYGNGSTLTPDARRDLANTLEYIIYQVELFGEVKEETKKESN